MAFDTSLDFADQLEPAPVAEAAPDLTNPSNFLLFQEWKDASPEKRQGELVGVAFDAYTSALEEDKTRTIRGLNAAGEEVDKPVFDTSGNYTTEGRETLARAKQMLEIAAQDPNGGVFESEIDGKVSPSHWVDGVLTKKKEKQPDRFSDMGAYIQEKQKITKEGGSPSLTYKEYTDFANAEVKNGEAHLDPDNKEMEKAFYAESAKRTFDPSSLGDDVMIGKVGDQYVMNPKNFNQIDKMEAAINGLDLSAADKKMMLIDYRSKVEENGGKIVNRFAAADAGVLGSIFSSPLRDEFIELMSNPNASRYEFLKANKDRIDKDSYGVGSEIAGTFRDAMMATGTGALWLASAGNYTSPAEAWGGLAEDTAGAYHNGKAFELFGVDINRRDLTELTGQIGSFVAMGGMGALAGKGLTAVGAQGASRYATNAAGQLLSTVAKTEAAAAAGTRTLGQKTLAGLKAIGTDPEVWLGSLQASGTSFGKTFNQEMNLHGDREKALKAANIEATSDGLSAFIATSVMNRVAPGMGKAFGMGDGAVGGGFIQNLKNKALTRESMEAVKETIENLGGDAGAALRTQFAKDLKGVMNTSARQLGLKGLGVLGNMGAEAVEESADEIISDVIGSMLDDSKTWTEDVWGNIGTKWKEYVKAGVLGAVGGAMGDASGTVLSPKQTFGKSEGYDIQQGEWNRIKENVEKFSIGTEYAFEGLNGEAKSVAEYIAMPKPEGVTEQEWIQKKSQALVSAAKGRVRMSVTAAMAPTSPDAASVEPSATAAAQASPKAQGEAGRDHSEGSLGHIMELTGVKPPEGKAWRKDVRMAEDGPVSLDKGRVLTPLFVESSDKSGRVDHVGAKLVTTENGVVKSTEYLSPEQAAKTLVMAGGKPRTALIDGFKGRATRDTQYEYDEWSEKQDGAGDGAGSAKPPAKQEGAGNSGATQGAQYRAASGSRQIVSSPISETLAPSERLKQQKSQQDTLATLDDHLSSPQTTDQQRVVLERLKQVHGNVEVLHDPDANDQTRYRVNGESFAGATSSLGAEDRFTYQGGEASESVKARNKQQTDIGTKLHSVLEGWQAGEPNNHKPNSKEWQLWKGLERVLGPLKAAGNVFLSETVVFDYENQVAGKMDMLMVSPDGTVTNIDMKTLEPKKKGDPHSPKSAYNQDKAADRGGNGRKSNQHDAQATMLLRMLHSMGVPTKSSDGMILFVDRDTGAIIKSETGDDFRKIDAAEDERVGIHFKKEPKQLDFSPDKEAPSATPAAETKKPTPPDENQTDAQREADAEAERKRLLTEETAGDSSSVVSGLREDLIGENKIGKSVKVNERDPSINFLGKDGVFVRKSNNEVVVTDEALTAALERHNGDSDAAFDDILQQIDDINGKHSSLSALDPSSASGASTLTHQEVVYVAKPELITGGTDELGGRWMMHTDTKTPEGFTPKSPTYSYVPPKGQSLTLGVGQVVAIGDNPNEVLMVTKVFKGTWEFEKVSLADARFDLINNKGKINQNNRWARTRLENVGVEFKDLFPKIVDKTITKKEMEGLFKAVLKIVSPNKDFKVVEKKLSGSDYVYADPVTKAITVDYGQLASKFAGLYGSANINEFSNALLGLDAARVLSSILDEEIVHLLGYEEFTRAEVLSFHKSILALPKDADGKNHPFHAMFLKTLEERFPGEKLNSSFRRKDENGKVVRSIEDGVYTVTSELMRKLHQLATSGTTTERATSLSRELQRMIFADGTEVAEKRSPLKVIGHMLRRYAERIRNILWMKWQQGTLTPEARQMLARLNAAYRKAGIQGDVDYGYDSATEEAEDRLDKYETAFKDEVGSIARFNSPALIQLRKVIGNFSHLSLEELLVVDRENMTLQIHDEARRYITDHKLMDLDEVDEVLAKLNDTTSDSPSYQKAMTVAFLKQQVMELKRDNLSFDPSKLFDEMRSESNGDVSKLGLWFDLLAGMPRNQISLDEMLDPLVVERNVVRDEVEMVRARAIAEAFKAVEAIDTKKGGFKAIKQLIQWGELSQVKRPWSGKTVGKYSVATNLEKGDVARPVTGHSLDAEKLTRSLKNPDRTNIAMEPLVASIEQGVGWEKKSPQEQLMNAKPEELAKMLADYQKAILQSLKLSMPSLSGADHKAFSKALGGGPVVDALARLNETETNLANLSENIQTLRDNGQRLVDDSDPLFGVLEKYKNEDGIIERVLKNKSVLKEFSNAFIPGLDSSDRDRLKAARSDDRLLRGIAKSPSQSNSVIRPQDVLSPDAKMKAETLYRQHIEFSKSVEDYNDAIQFVKRRALGDFTVNNRGYGLNLYDLNVSEGKGTNLKYTSYTDKLTPATTSDEVFQGVVEDKLPTDDNRFAYGYASRFFYPKEVDGVKQPLTDYQQSWNDGLEIYRSKMSSNADFIGKASFLNFWVNKQLGNIRSIGASDSYEQTGGFSFEKIVNDGDAEIYVRAEEAFPDFAAGDLGSIKRGLGFANGNSKPVLEVVKFIQSVNAWSQKVRSNYQDGYGSSVVETIGGEQTIAARMVPMLDKFFSRLELVEDDRIATVVYGEGLDSDLKTFFGSVVAVLQNHFEISDDFMVDGEFSMPEGQIDDFMDVFKYDDNGQLVKRKGDATTHAAIAKNLSEKFFGASMEKEGFSVKLRNSVNAVKLVRKTMRGFQKPDWRKNVEKEGSRVQRDPAYDPDNVAMLKLRENVADARILGNLGWAIEYFERPRDYVFGANWAFELLKGIEESNYGDGREPFVRVTQSTKGRETTPQERFDFSEGEGYPNNRFVAGVNRIQNSTYSEVNSDSQVVGPYDYAGEDDSRVSMFTGGESVSTVKGYNDTYNPGGNSTPFESSQRAYGRASVSRAMKLTVAALFIGSNSTAGRSSAAGRQFYFDMMRAERESGWFTAEDVIGERAKVGPKPFGMVTDPVTGQNQSRYSDAEIEGMEQDELHRVFSRAMNDNLLRRGLQGLFPSFNATGAGRFSTAIYDAFLSEYGRTNGNLEDGYVYEFHNSEKFITDLLSFKTKFERMVVERARVKNGDDNVSALKTVLAATNEPSEQFSNLDKALKKKDGKGFSLSTDYDGKLSKRPNNFVSDSEATAIAKLIHEGMMVEKYVLADTQLGTGMGTGNGMIDHLVDALPGRTMVLSIDVDRAARSGLKDVGLRVFQGDGKTPNVIYFPTSQSGHRFQGERAGGVIAQLLRISADGNPKVADKIREMAGTMREALNPAKHAEEGRLIHWRSQKKKGYKFIPATVGGMSTSLRLSLLSGDTEIGRSLTGIDPQLAADIVLISEVLSSEDAKVLLDDAHAVIDSLQDTELPHQVEKDIMDSIRHVRMKGLDEVGRFGDETDQISDEPVEDENEDPEMTVDGPGELQDITDPLEMSENPFLADRDLDETQQIIEQTGETNPEMARVKRMQDFGQSDRSDVFLFNGVAAIVQAGKALNGEVSEEQADGLREKMDRKGQARDDTARSILGNETLTGKNEREKLDVARAGAVVESPMDKAGRIYVGEAKNLTMPKAGGRTALNLAFYDTRINNTNASMLHRVGSIEAVINEKALTEITQALQKKSRDNKEYNLKNEGLASLGFSRQDVKVELTDALVDELKTTLPKGVIEAAMAEVRESVDNLEINKERLQGVLAGLKQSREARLVENSDNINKNWAGTDYGFERDARGPGSVKKKAVENLNRKVGEDQDRMMIIPVKGEKLGLMTADEAVAYQTHLSAVEENDIRQIDRQIARVERDLLEIREALSEIDHHPSVSKIGRTYFRGEAGVAAQVDQRSGKVLGDGVDKALRSVGINLSFYAPGTNSDTEQERWHDFTSDEAMADTEMKARRREHYIREQAVTGALTKLSTDHIDDAYRLVRNTTDNFLTFDPLKVIRQAVDMAQVESLVMKDQMGLARTDAETAEMRGLSADAVAMLTDPLNPDKVEALTRTQQNKMKILNLPKSSALRREKIGSLFNQEGQAVVLVPTTVREQLMRAFPHRVTKRNVESVLSHTALRAIDISANPDSENHSYFFGTVDAIKDEAFNGDGFSLTKGKTLTKEQAGKVFSGEYVRKLQVFLDAIRNQSNPEGKKKVDLSHRVTQAQIKQYGFMIERLAMVYNDEKKLLSEDTKKQVGELLTAISDSGLKSFSMIEVDPFTGKQNTLNMMRFRVEEAFSKVFSEVEGELISNRLASGMSIHNGATSLFAMKYLHHQDARIRNRFRRTYAARQTALHLNAFLERGMDGKSGRSAYQTSKKEAQDTIAESAKLVGNSALDQTLGYFHSILSGLDHANGLDYLSAFKEFVRQGANGFNQMDDFVKTQNGFYGKNKLAKYWNGTHIDMVRDHELSMKVRSIIKKSIEGKDPTTEAAAREIVERVQAALLAATTEGKRDSVKNYSETLSRVLGDIDTAMHVTMAMLSKEGSDPVNEAKSKWKHNEVRSFKRTYSSVPMKFGYAGRPGTKAAQVEGRYVSDAIDIVAFDDASFFGGIGRSSKQYDDKSVYRPISVNGLVAPLSLIDDAIYRLNVTPTYEVLRRSIGQVVDEKGVLTVQDGGVLARLQQDSPDPTNPDAEYHRLQYEHDKRIKAAKTALASVANELEQVIHNDSQVGVVNTGGAEVLRFMSSAFIVRSLASVQQMWDQTSGPSLGYISGKIAVGKPKMAATYMKIIGMYLSKKQFRIDAKKFIMATAPPVYYRSSDGRDVVKDESRGQKRFGGSNAKNISGKLVRQYEKVGEDAIHFTIGAGERMLATASFLTELMDQMKINDLSGLLKGEHGDKMNIMHVVNSQQKVNDMMAQSDQSKKSWMFQSRETSPGMSALWRALVQFSNHTSSMASNMTVMMPMALSKVDKNAGKLDENGNIIPPMEGFIDQKSHEEALENVVTTLVQNILFAPFKAKVLVPVLAYIIARTMMGDDDEDAVRNAQEMANNVLAPQEDGNVAANFAKMLVFGKQREFFRSDLDEDAAFASAVAEIGAKSLVELATTIPVLGVAAGYSPVSGLAQKLVLNDASESTVALLSGLPKSKFYFDDGGVQVRSYDGGWADNATGITAPTSAAMDMAQAAKLLLDYNLTSTAGDNRVDSSLNSAIYAFTELVPFLRDARGHMKGVLSNVVKEEQD